jgi:predicted ester cyclase
MPGLIDSIDGDALLMSAKALHTEVLARRYYDMFNSRSFDEAERLVDPQAVFIYPAAKEHFIGRAGYRELVRRWLQGVPDGRLMVTNVTVRGVETVQTDWIGEGTHTGVLELPGLPPIQATGRHARFPMRETIRIVNGLIAESRMEFDPAALRRVLGF